MNRICKTSISDCQFDKNYTATSIMARGCDSVDVSDCKINSCIVGISIDQVPLCIAGSPQ